MTAWSDDDKEDVKRLWLIGESAGQISGKYPGRSRQAILGIVHRAGLVKRNGNSGGRIVRGPKAPIEKRGRTVTLTPTKQAIELRKLPEPDPLRLEDGQLVTTEDLRDGMCRWPHGEVGSPDFHFCANPQADDSSWCVIHKRRSVQPRGQRREVTAEDKDNGRKAERMMARMGF